MNLVLDWDGTVTEVDSLHMVLLEFGDAGVYERAEEGLGRQMTLHDVIGLEFSTVRAPLEQVTAWLVENVRVRAGFSGLVERFRPLVVSSGFHELIEPILAREGVGVELRANSLDPRPDGWRVHWRDETVCPVCGEACKRASVANGPFVYVGDGYSDRCVALAADRVFARDGLADYLDGQGIGYEPFDTLLDVAGALSRSASPRSRRS
ncbi:MAG: haloacid dehalogenase-like hydrolase [Verrucomicrobiota bacterium]